MQLNPGWNSSSVNLLHVQAVGPGDTLHYVWSSIGAPAVLLVATESASSVLRINWTQLLSPTPAGAVWIDPPSSVIYSAAIVFTKVRPRMAARPQESLRGAGGAGRRVRHGQPSFPRPPWSCPGCLWLLRCLVTAAPRPLPGGSRLLCPSFPVGV